MSSELGPLEVDCDSPPYAIVQACERLTLQTPLDVRWCRMSQFLMARGEGFHIFSSRSWKQLFGGQTHDVVCSCGAPLPTMERFTFTYLSSAQAEYFLGQCARCRTIFWEEVPSMPFRNE